MSRPDAAARLFCFSHAGGNASVYAPWARALGNRPIEVVAAQLPGRNGDRHEAPSGDRGVGGPAHLFVSGAHAPQLPSDGAPLRFIEGDTAFLEAVAAKYGGVPRIVLEQADLRVAVVPALRADLALTETYTYRDAPPLTCPIAAYAGALDPIVSEEGLAGWREHTTGEFTCRLFAGHHFYLNRERDALLADITRRLFRTYGLDCPPAI